MAALAVFAPAPLLTVAVERTPGGADEIHVHAGGQGVWAGRMAVALGAEVRCCCPLAGEAGRLLEGLLAGEGFAVRAVRAEAGNGGWVEDHRGGSPRCVAEVPTPALTRHSLDELCTLTLHEALDTGTCVLTGSGQGGVVPSEVFERLARDLGANGCRVVADLSGADLAACLRGGPSAVKLDAEELEGLGLAANRDGVRRLHDGGVSLVVVSRGPRPVLASTAGGVFELVPPPLSAVETRGTGDSMTGAMAARLAAGADGLDAVRVAVAAGALNVARRGLGTGRRDQIEALADRVDVTEVC